jgi:sec-independent protein translocase protein TatB
VFENLGGLEIVGLVLVALFIIGPDRLPKVISDTMGFLRKVRSMARNATSDLSRELGTNIELEDLHPKTFLRKHLLSEAEEDALRKPFQDAFREVKSTADALNFDKSNGAKPEVTGAADKGTAAGGSNGDAGRAVTGITGAPDKPASTYRYDDAT